MKGGGSYSNYHYHTNQLASAEHTEIHLPNQHTMINDVVLPASYDLRGLVDKKITTTSYSPPTRPHKKKQVRRRLHTARPHLLNMAQARKEIVTALKFHRASMKTQQQQQPPPSLLSAQSSSLLGLNLSFHEFTHLDFATLYRSNNPDVTPALSSSSPSASPHESAATDSAGSSVPHQVGTPPPCQFDDEMEWNYSFLFQEGQFEQEFPLFSDSSDTSAGTNLGLPCMKLEEFDEEWLSWH